MRRLPLSVSVSFAALMIGSPAMAAGASDQASPNALSPNQSDEMPYDASNSDRNPIVVTGAKDNYATKKTSTATKTDTPLINVPQSIKIISREQMDDQALHSIGDVVRYVAGVTLSQGEGNRDQIVLRGQSTTADFFLDGVRDDVQYYRGLYNIEQVEILKGPSAMIFGRGGGGGVVNRVQKTAQLDKNFMNANASINSFADYDFSADANAALGSNVAFRVNGNYEKLANHRDYFGGERYAVNPTATVNLGADWVLGASYEYVHDDRVADRGVPSLGGVPITGYRDRFFGIPGVNRTGIDAHLAKARLDGAITDNLKFNATISYGNYDKYYRNVQANAAATSQTGTVALAGYTNATQRENWIGQANLIWDVATGSIQHKILVGTEIGKQDSASQRLNATLSFTNLSLSNPIYPTATFTIPATDNASYVNTVSVYAQDQISLSDHFDILAGLRYDRFEIKGTDYIPVIDRNFARTDTKISPRFGLIYKPQENISLYGSYSVSFLPRSGDQFAALTIVQENLAPERFTNLELGGKWDLASGLSLTAAVFQLDRTNATTPDPLNPLVTINVGTTRTRGVEAGFSGQVTPKWQISGGASYQEGALKENSAVTLSQLPRFQASLWNRYNISKEFGAGLGIIHQSSEYAAIKTASSVTLLPEFTRVDAALFLNPSDRLQFQFNIENLLDTDYYSDASGNNNISTGAPINARFTARMRF